MAPFQNEWIRCHHRYFAAFVDLLSVEEHPEFQKCFGKKHNMADILVSVLFLANAIWFGMGFIAFFLRREVFAKVLVPNRADRENSAYAALVESGRFMGGFNFALSILNVCLLLDLGGFVLDRQVAFLLLFNSLVHGTQFVGNVPMALQNRNGGGLWNVFKGVMLQIFVIDFTLMTANAILALVLLI